MKKQFRLKIKKLIVNWRAQPKLFWAIDIKRREYESRLSPPRSLFLIFSRVDLTASAVSYSMNTLCIKSKIKTTTRVNETKWRGKRVEIAFHRVNIFSPKLFLRQNLITKCERCAKGWITNSQKQPKHLWTLSSSKLKNNGMWFTIKNK
jgi:hypothetical protein